MALGSLGSRALLKSLEDQDLDAPRPRVTLYTWRSDRLRRQALALADTGRADDQAALDLARAAGRHRKELRRAAAAIRTGGADVEELAAYQANQLLLAAASGQPVVALSEERERWFHRVRALREDRPGVAFAELTSCEPALADLERDVVLAAGRPEFMSMDDEHRVAAVRNLYVDRLAAIVEHAVDPMMRTRIAARIVRCHLLGIAGLADPQGGPED